jgi:hypothetical protein
MRMPLFLAVVLLAGAASASAIDENILFKAMEDELQRNMRELAIGDLARPYHIEYELKRSRHTSARAVLGTVNDIDTSYTTILTVRCRVGAPRFDNTNFFDVSLGFFGSADDEERFKSRVIPNELSYDMLRRELWLATDACYKQAVEIYSKKSASTRNRTRQDTTWDFGFMLADDNSDLENGGIRISAAEVITKVEAISAVFRSAPSVHASRVGMEFNKEEVLYLNSEGRRSHKVDCMAGLEIVASTQAADGMPLLQTYTAYSIDPKDLPSTDSLKRAATAMISAFTGMADAPSIEPYSGPVLFEGQAAAQILAKQFVPHLVAQRKPMSEGGFSAGGETMAFQNKVGARVLPEFLSLVDDPSLDRTGETPCAGSYMVDDEGIPAQTVQLVEKGYLKTLLASRVPTRRVHATNGHMRGGGPMPGVLVLTCEEDERALNAAAMKKRLLELVEARDLEYGIVVREILDQNILSTVVYQLLQGDLPMMRDRTSASVLEAVKVYRDGHEEPLRGVVASGFNTFLFKDILAVGTTAHVHNYLAPSVIPAFITGGSQYVASTIVTPDLLFEDVEVKQQEGDLPKPPRLASPLTKTGK